jgi:branched-chain amino acid transport system ATP-binding protein
MAEALVQASGLSKHFGGVVATDNVTLALSRGEIHAVIGPNGAGKTTLINQLTGELFPDSGSILLDGRDITREPPAARARAGLARAYQIVSVFPAFSVLQNVALAVQATQPHSFRFWREAGRDERLLGPARGILARLGLEARTGSLASELSHGEQRQLELAMALATRPRVLLLDEPTAGMGHEESRRIIGLLGTLKSDYAILLVEHDMNAVFALADVITVLVYGRIVASGAPDQIRADAEVKRAYLGEKKSARRHGGKAH